MITVFTDGEFSKQRGNSTTLIVVLLFFSKKKKKFRSKIFVWMIGFGSEDGNWMRLE